jgi:hypothetical protein
MGHSEQMELVKFSMTLIGKIVLVSLKKKKGHLKGSIVQQRRDLVSSVSD